MQLFIQVGTGQRGCWSTCGVRSFHSKSNFATHIYSHSRSDMLFKPVFIIN